MPAENYCTIDEIKALMPDTPWGATYDTVFTTLAKRASRALDRFCVRRPGSFKLLTDETIYLNGDSSQSLWVELAQAPTSVSVAESGDLSNYTLWASTEYFAWPYNNALFGEPYLRLDINEFGTKLLWPKYQKSIKIVGRNGFSITPPEEIIQVTIIQAVRWFKRGQQAFKDTGAIVELSQLTYTQALDPDIAEMIAYFKRQAV